MLLKSIYFGMLGLGLLCSLLYPIWIGHFYNSYPVKVFVVDTPAFKSGQIRWSDGGQFGLAGAMNMESRALIWDPPHAHDPTIQASVRWPFQRPSQRSHVEISVSMLLRQMSMLIVGLGAVGWVCQKFSRQPPTLFSMTTVYVSVFQFVALVGIFVLFVISSGYAAVDEVTIPTYLIALVVGVLFGVWRAGRLGSEKLAAKPAA